MFWLLHAEHAAEAEGPPPAPEAKIPEASAPACDHQRVRRLEVSLPYCAADEIGATLEFVLAHLCSWAALPEEEDGDDEGVIDELCPLTMAFHKETTSFTNQTPFTRAGHMLTPMLATEQHCSLALGSRSRNLQTTESFRWVMSTGYLGMCGVRLLLTTWLPSTSNLGSPGTHLVFSTDTRTSDQPL
jgi:hypothetical protein